MIKIPILCTLGTRPEAIKMAPVIEALREAPWADVRVLVTGQHRELLDDLISIFDLRPDIKLDVMAADQTLAELTGKLAPELDRILVHESPRIVLAQGDTTSVFMMALAAFYRKIPFGHIEAGLRTWKRYYPFPEEINRTLATRLATWHFAPTAWARENLLREGIDPTSIYVTGNTGIDALFKTLERKPQGHHEIFDRISKRRRVILMTAHRRENFGPPFHEVCEGARALVDEIADTELVYPIHPNPNVTAVAREVMSGHPRIHLIDPIQYPDFVMLMQRAEIILTDSGGIQEEAPALGKPVLVFRLETERPEAVEAGVVKLVGPDRKQILAEGKRLLGDPAYYKSMARGISPYGDGRAAKRIADVLKELL